VSPPGDNEPILSNEESSALLDAMHGDGSAGGGRRSVETADLTAPERHLRGALRRADRAVLNVARTLARHLLQSVGASVLVAEQPAEIAPFSLVTSTLGTGAVVAGLATSGSPFAGLVTVGPLLSAFYLDRRLGAPLQEEDDRSEIHPREELSAVERRLAAPLVAHLVETFCKDWCGHGGALRAQPVLRNAEELPDHPGVEPVLRMTVRVTFGAVSDEVVVCLSAGAVRDTTGEDLSASGPTQAALPGDRMRLAAGLAHTPVDVIALLGAVQMNVRDVLELEVGDVVRLDTAPATPTPVRVDGITVLEGRPVVSHGNLAIEVSDVF